MDERILIAIGVVMVIVGIGFAVYAGPMEMRAQATYSDGDVDAGESLRLQADAFRYGGLGLAGFGVVMMAGSWVKFVIENSRRI